MSNEQSDKTTHRPKLRWNDIRIVGPVLIAVLAAAIIINPTFVSANHSVGDGQPIGCEFGGVAVIDPCCVDAPVGFIINPCETPTATPVPPTATPVPPTATPVPPTATPVPPTATAVPPTATTVPPTAVPTATIEAIPTPTTSSGPVVRIPPTPAVIIGPTWLGPIRATESNGIVTLRFPILLSVFVGPQGEVQISSGGLVYSGPLPSNRQISFPAPASADTVTVQTVLINDAKYTEVVTVVTTVS